jgi:hypothetical protein
VLGDRNLDTASARPVGEFKKLRVQNISPVALKIERHSLRAAFITALRREYLPANPFAA